MNIYAIILAAGKGTRMKSLDQSHSKVSHPILGMSLVQYVLRALKPIQPTETFAIVGFGGEVTTQLVQDSAKVVWQHEQKGTGHAVQQVASYLSRKEGTTIVLCGDTPLLTSQTLSSLLEEHIKNKHDLTVLTCIIDQPKGYGRIVRDKQGLVDRIVEQADATIEEQGIREVNTGVYVFNNKLLFEQLVHLSGNNKQGELYLTDVIKMFKNKGYHVGASILPDSREMLGINDRVQLSEATKIMKLRINRDLMLSGVTIEDPDNTYIGPEVTIGQDSVIRPGTRILGKTSLGKANIVGPETSIENTIIGDNNTIVKSQIVDCHIGNENQIGPFTHLRGHCEIGNKTRVGNFVEMKNGHLSDGVKSAHLTYIGDCTIGENTNIGCGTITANYDGKHKYHTEIGKNVFVGSGSTLIAPITLADNSFVAAGSTLTTDVGEDDLAIARARQENKVGYAKVLKAKINSK